MNHDGANTAAGPLFDRAGSRSPKGLNTLPRDYASLPPQLRPPAVVPQLGPPLPGDLGRPFLRAEQEGGGIRERSRRLRPDIESGPAPSAATPGRTGAAPSRDESCRSHSTLFVQVGQRELSSTAKARAKLHRRRRRVLGLRPDRACCHGSPQEFSVKPRPSPPESEQDRKTAFLNGCGQITKIYASGRVADAGLALPGHGRNDYSRPPW